MQKSIFVPEYPLDGMCSDNTSFEDYTEASYSAFSLVPEGDFVVDTPTFTGTMNIANVSDEEGLNSAIASYNNGENIIIRLTCDIVTTSAIEINGIGDIVIDGCGHHIFFVEKQYTPKSYIGDVAVCPYKGKLKEGKNTFVTPDGTILRLSRSNFYNAAGGITTSKNLLCSFLLPEELESLNILQDENVYVNFTVSFRSYTAKVWTTTNNGSTSLCFQVKDSYNYNADYADYHRPTSFFFINKDLSQDACLIKDSNLYFPSLYEWVGELNGGFSIKSGNIKFQNLQLTGTAPIKAEGEARVVLHKCAIYGATEKNAIEIALQAKAYLSQCEVYDCLGNGILAKYGSTICVTDSYFHNIGLLREQSEAIESRGKYYIARNKIEDFCYGAIRVGIIDKTVALSDTNQDYAKVDRNAFPCSGIVEYNNISLSPVFYDNADHLVVIDSGAIYIATNNGSEKESLETEAFISKNIGCTLDDTNVCVVRFNHIKNYRGRKTNRGIYCDDDAYNFLLLGNIIENTPNDHSISARFAGAERQTFYPKKSYNKKVFYNVVDNGFRFEGNMTSVKELRDGENFDGCEMKYNLYLNKYGNLSNIIRYTSREDNVYVDDTGFFTEDGRIDSAYNIKEWNINIKNRRHERK